MNDALTLVARAQAAAPAAGGRELSQADKSSLKLCATQRGKTHILLMTLLTLINKFAEAENINGLSQNQCLTSEDPQQCQREVSAIGNHQSSIFKYSDSWTSLSELCDPPQKDWDLREVNEKIKFLCDDTFEGMYDSDNHTQEAEKARIFYHKFKIKMIKTLSRIASEGPCRKSFLDQCMRNIKALVIAPDSFYTLRFKELGYAVDGIYHKTLNRIEVGTIFDLSVIILHECMHERFHRKSLSYNNSAIGQFNLHSKMLVKEAVWCLYTDLKDKKCLDVVGLSRGYRHHEAIGTCGGGSFFSDIVRDYYNMPKNIDKNFEFRCTHTGRTISNGRLTITNVIEQGLSRAPIDDESLLLKFILQLALAEADTRLHIEKGDDNEAFAHFFSRLTESTVVHLHQRLPKVRIMIPKTSVQP